MSRPDPRRLALAGICALAIFAAPAAARQPGFARADSLQLTGRYAEARTAYSALGAREPVAAAIGLARCLAATGENERAIETLSAAAAKHPADAALHAELAGL